AVESDRFGRRIAICACPSLKRPLAIDDERCSELARELGRAQTADDELAAFDRRRVGKQVQHQRLSLRGPRPRPAAGYVGCQVGLSSIVPLVKRRTPEPSAFITNNVASRAKTIFVPSDDHVGVKSRPSGVSVRSSLPSALTTAMAKPLPLRLVYVSLDASG